MAVTKTESMDRLQSDGRKREDSKHIQAHKAVEIPSKPVRIAVLRMEHGWSGGLLEDERKSETEDILVSFDRYGR